MNIIRAIQEKYALEDGRTELVKSKETTGIFVKTDIQHWIDVKDSKNIWSKGNVNTMTYNVEKSTWTLKIDFPNWKGEEIEYVVDIDHDEHPRLAPFQTHVSKEGVLGRNLSSGTPCSRINCYLSSDKEALKGHHRWHMAELRNNGRVLIACHTAYRRALGLRRALEPHEYTYYTSPCSDSLRSTPMYEKIFTKLEEEIVKDIKTKKKKIAKEKRDVIKKIKKEGKVVLNKYTVEYCKTNPKKVKKTCYAFRNNWVNVLGVPQSWCRSQRLIKKMHKYCLRYMTTFMSGDDILRLICVNRKQNADIRDINFFKGQAAELRRGFGEQALKCKNETGERDSLDNQCRRIEGSMGILEGSVKVDPSIGEIVEQMNKKLGEKVGELVDVNHLLWLSMCRKKVLARKLKVMYTQMC
tara:strand:+ start:1352 stop:2584 length:1233 start_codon:yes stop_codon:yes gene_type:complete